MDHLGVFDPPYEGFFYDHPDCRWPAHKFNLKLNDVFTTLPRQFNCISIPILDADAFSRDVSEISHCAQDRQEFDHLLAERRDQRQRELLDLWRVTFNQIATTPDLIGEGIRWAHAMHIYHSKSLDSYVRYFAGFLEHSDAILRLPPAMAVATTAAATTPSTTTPTDEASSETTPPTSINSFDAQPGVLGHQSLQSKVVEKASTVGKRHQGSKRGQKTAPASSKGVRKKRPNNTVLRRSSRIRERERTTQSGYARSQAS